MRGKKYDYAGVTGWLVCKFLKRACGYSGRVYCFEAADSALKAAGYRGSSSAALSGCDVRKALPGAPRYQIFTGE